jgi:hypothetical protein
MEHDDILGIAERCLQARSGRAAQLRLLRELSDAERRNLVLRCELDDGTGVTRRVILKQARGNYDPNDLDAWDTRRLLCDWLGAELLSSLSGHHAARFLGGDFERGLVILEDLGEHRIHLKSALLGTDAAEATRALELLMLRLAQMHGETSRELGHYDRLLQALTRAELPRPLRYFGQDSAEKLAAFLREIEPLTDELAGALQAAVDAVVARGPFAALIQGDPCLENALLDGDDLKLIDFELGRPAHALLDAVYVLSPFPTCSCTGLLPRELSLHLLERYRQELAKHVTAAAHVPTFNAEVLRACEAWLVYRLGWLLPQAWHGTDQRVWERGTTPGRLLTALEQYLWVSRHFGGSARLYGHASRLLEQLASRWPNAERLTLFPAFQPR